MNILKKVAVTFILLLCGSGLVAQAGTFEMPDVETLFRHFETRLEQPGGDTAHYIFVQAVRSHCGDNDDCSRSAYFAILEKLQAVFNLPACIYLVEELVKIAKKAGHTEEEAYLYRTISNFHDALGNRRLAVLYLDRALALFESLDNRKEVVKTHMLKLKASLSYRDKEEVLADMEALLEKTIVMGDTLGEEYIRLRLVEILMEAQRYDAIEAHIIALDKRKISDPIPQNEYAFLINLNITRANLARAKGQLDTAMVYYRKTLAFAEAEPGLWIQAHVMNILGELEWEQNNRTAAKSYLERARSLGEKIKVYDLLTTTFALLARIAETEGRYKEALEYTNRKYHADQQFKGRSADFSMQAYVLQLDNERLETERQKDQVVLQLKNYQLLSSVFIATLVLLLAGILFIVLRRRSIGLRQLAKQHELITLQSEQLKSLDLAKSRFFANVSHELRTPLSLVLGPINTLLKDSRTTDRQVQLLEMARQGGQNLQYLVDEILDLGKIEAGKMELNPAPTPVARFFRQYFAQFESLAHQKRVTYSYEIRPDDSLAILLDGEKCRQIIFNLLSNAFKFTPSGGSIKAVVKMEAEQLHIEIADTGSGIHPDDLPHIFDLYFQTRHLEMAATGGTGIGLTLCQEYARLFGGGISAESTPGKGTILRVVFPVEPAAEDLPDAHETLSGPWAAGFDNVQEADGQRLPVSPDASALAAPGPKPTILVVEDNLELQHYISLILEEHYQIILAENGQAALDVLRSSGTRPAATSGDEGPVTAEGYTVDLILSDLMMPVMDGYQLLEKLKTGDATRHIPVIMLTARADRDDRLKALRIGVDDYLTKPFDEEELQVRIENLLKNQSDRANEPIAEEEKAMTPPALSVTDQEWLQAFEEYVYANMSDILSVPVLASRFAMSESTLLRQLKRLTGLTPVQYLSEIRLALARQLLEERAYRSVSQVASRLGFDDAAYFSRIFKRRYGKLPSEYLNN